MKKLLLALIAFSSFSMAQAVVKWDLGGTEYYVDTVYHVTVGPGMTTTAIRMEGAQQGVNNTIKNNVFYTTIDLTNPNLELRVVMGKDAYASVESVKSMGDRKNKEGKGQYLVGVNGDFFNMGGDNKTLGSLVVNGDIIHAAPYGSWGALNSYVVVNDRKNLEITEDFSIVGNDMFVNGMPSSPLQAIAGIPVIVSRGKYVGDDYITAHDGPNHFNTNQARTAIGYNKDRTKLIMLVVDKFTQNKYTQGEYAGFKASTGFAMKRMGQLMEALGCYTAMAFDGGGSSQLYNKELGIRNVPYGEAGYLRPVANGIFAVSTTPVDNNITSLEVFEKNVHLVSGEKYTPTVFGYNKYGVLVDRNVKDFTLTVAPKVGTVSGTTLTAGTESCATHMIVRKGDAVCGAYVSVNQGTPYVSSGEVPEAVLPYEPEEPMGCLDAELVLDEKWSFVNDSYNSSWDASVPDWTSPDAIKSASCPLYATARKGKFYTVDMKTMSIAEIGEDGVFTPKYRLPELAEPVDGAKDYYGCAISSDDAGNFIIGHSYSKAASFYVWTIYSPESGKCKHFTLPMNGKKNNPIDCVGRAVGDVTRDGWLFVAPSYDGGTFQKGNMIHFTGTGDIESVEAKNKFTPMTYLSNRTGSVCQSIYSDAADISSMRHPENAVLCYSKSDGFSQYSNSLYSYNTGALGANAAAGWENYAGTSGFDVFRIGGRLYYVMNYVDATDYPSNKCPMDIIVTDAQLNTVAQWKSDVYKSNEGTSSVTAVPVSDNAVEIYVYNCGSKIAGAYLRLYAEGHEGDFTDYTGITDITAGGFEEDCAPVYYNLFGHRIANPAGGIYIVRRGSKVSKEYIR